MLNEIGEGMVVSTKTPMNLLQVLFYFFDENSSEGVRRNSQGMVGKSVKDLLAWKTDRRQKRIRRNSKAGETDGVGLSG
jgi:hypothetical protein